MLISPSSFVVSQLSSFIPPGLYLSDLACDSGILNAFNQFIDVLLEDLRFHFITSLHYI